MNEQLKLLEELVSTALILEAQPTSTKLRSIISDLRESPLADQITDTDAENLARKLEERISIRQDIGSFLTEESYQPWLDSARSSIEPYYWDRYKRLLSIRGLAPNSLSSLDNSTDRILNLLHNPLTEGPWDRRGMVIGHVQSGKTQNYTGLICKAADAGYRLIVVIAGIHNRLRNQTQARVDEGFVGHDSTSLLKKRASKFIGVGKLDQRRRPTTFTNSIRDFNKQSATSVGLPLQNLVEPAVFVIKKNTSTLKNLIEWIREYNSLGHNQRVSEPMLLIDDEADNASINIKSNSLEISRINGQIRDLLSIFERSCYVGYTATPFANIFIDPETDDEMLGQDLFPKHFIVSLEPPSNYIGANTVFLDRPSDFVRHISDNEQHLPLVHNKETILSSLPPSLLLALRTFIVAKAIRMARGQQAQHCSMLVNASRFVNVQRQLRNYLHAELDGIRSALRINGARPPHLAIMDPQIQQLHLTWQEEYSEDPTTWPVVLQHLYDAVSSMRTVEVNSQSSDEINYSDSTDAGLNVIAIGGFSLSRGLTLEGLTVSYFMRNSIMYDTLMQMGRWFGYRPGYDDLCRIWMLEEAQGWYEHITESADALREEIRSMEVAGASPEDFGLKVRSHPDTLIVTARNKMGSGSRVTVNVSLANRLVETHMLRRDNLALGANRVAANDLAVRLAADGYTSIYTRWPNYGWLSRGVPAGHVLDFLEQFTEHPSALLTHGNQIRNYIAERIDDELKVWDITYTTLRLPDHPDQSGHDELSYDVPGLKIRCQNRKEGNSSDVNTLLVGNRQRVSSRGIERTGLTRHQIADAESDHRSDLKQRGKLVHDKVPNYPDRIYRSRRNRPLLMIHALSIQAKDELPPIERPVIAWGISFPRTNLAERRVEYVVNTTWLREHYGEDMEEDEALEDEI